jgi:hypothetical protein
MIRAKRYQVVPGFNGAALTDTDYMVSMKQVASHPFRTLQEQTSQRSNPSRFRRSAFFRRKVLPDSVVLWRLGHNGSSGDRIRFSSWVHIPFSSVANNAGWYGI